MPDGLALPEMGSVPARLGAPRALGPERPAAEGAERKAAEEPLPRARMASRWPNSVVSALDVVGERTVAPAVRDEARE